MAQIDLIDNQTGYPVTKPDEIQPLNLSGGGSGGGQSYSGVNADWNQPGGLTNTGNTPAAGQPSMNTGDVQAAYQKAFGRSADPRELASELENANKYGAAGIQNQIARRTNNAPNSGDYGTPDWSKVVSQAQQQGVQGNRGSGQPTSSAYGGGVPMPGNQFSDPYTSMLESIAKSQLQQYQQPVNASPYDELMKFVTQRFQELSQHPGYSPQEQAMLNTQVSEPIEALRATSRQRALQHAAQAGYLPTSGITDLTSSANGLTQPFDVNYDQMRTAANRDLGINALNRRNQDLASALDLGKLNIQLPSQQFGEQQGRNNAALQLATLLQQLPAQAQAEALAVINGTQSPGSLLPAVNQIAQQNQQRNYQTWASLGGLAASLGL